MKSPFKYITDRFITLKAFCLFRESWNCIICHFLHYKLFKCIFLRVANWSTVKRLRCSDSNPCRVWRIYSNIRIFKYFWSEYLFGYSFVSFFGYEYIRIFVRVNFLDTNIFEIAFVARFWFRYIRTFVRINFQDRNRFRRCFYWFSLDIILCLWIFCWYQWSKMLFRL